MKATAILLNKRSSLNQSAKNLVQILLGILILLPLNVTAQEQAKYWVFFKRDHGKNLEKINKSIENPKKYISERSIARRQKVFKDGQLILEGDLPIENQYILDLENHGFHPVVISRWLNGVSLYLSDAERRWIEQLSYVSGVQMVPLYYKHDPESPAPERASARLLKPLVGLNYGQSLTQNTLMHVPEVHNLGITGKNVFVGMLDTGFDRNHEALSGIRVVAEWDFINKDGITANQPGDPVSQERHGTTTLGTIAGFKSEQLIGPAYESEFALAKTEIVDNEIAVEEDYWVAAIEWMDSLGVEVVSSSLGYASGFQDRPDYVFSQLDGKTAVTTIAAEEAVTRGMVVVNSMGNERQTFWKHLITPADGPHVIAVGAVAPNGWLSSFSSPGPTADGRIKPDCVAMGEMVYGVGFNPAGHVIYNGYTYLSGTSYSCPLTAGIVALILSTHPELTPAQVMEAIHMTADRWQQPDNDYGYGMVNAYKAITYYGAAFSNEPKVEENGTNYRVTIAAAASPGIPANGMSLNYRFSGEIRPFTAVLMSPGTSSNSFTGEMPATALLHDSITFYFSAQDSSGKASRWPKGNSTFSQPLILHIPEQYSMMQNFPNPFNDQTQIAILLPEEAFVTLKVYNILGQELRTLAAQYLTAGRYFFSWDGRNAKGDKVATGIYIYRLHTSKFSQAKKMLFLK